MTPAFEIEVGGKSYTQKIKARLVELTVVDLAGASSDSLEITLDDRDNLQRPAHGAILTCHIGYKGKPLIDKGQYSHYMTEFEGSSRRMVIRATAVDFIRDKGLKSERSRSFDDKTLGDIVTSVAEEHGYKAVVDDFVKDIPIPHLDQVNESDLNLLRRLARQYGATFKASAGLLVFFQRGDKREALGIVTLRPSDVSTWNVSREDRSRYTVVAAKWHDLDAAQTKTAMVGEEGGSIRTLPHPFADETAAMHAAQAELNRLAKATATVRLTLPGNPLLRAEGGLTLDGFRDGIDDDYTITRVEHSISKKGYKCKVQAELAK